MSDSEDETRNLNLELEWRHREISAKYDRLTDAMVFGKQHSWKAAEPMMNQKMVLDPPEVGKRYLLMGAPMLMLRLRSSSPGVFLLKHREEKEPSLVMRKLSTIVYIALGNVNGQDFDAKVTNVHGEGAQLHQSGGHQRKDDRIRWAG